MLGDFLIVVAHNGNGLAYLLSKFLEGFVTAHRHEVVRTKDRVGPRFSGHQFQRRLATPARQKVTFGDER